MGDGWDFGTTKVSLSQPIDKGPAKQLSNFTEGRVLSFDWSRNGNLIASRGVVTSDVVLITDAGP